MKTLNEISKTIISLASDYDVEEIYIFGSYARGEADENSDLDIAIRAPNMPILKISSLSYKIEKELDLRIDMIAMESMDDEFLRTISKEAVKVYEK